MKKQRMNVQTVAEILIDELSKIEALSKKFEQAAAKVEASTSALASKPIKVDLSELRQTVADHKNALLQSVIVPKWLAKIAVYTVIGCFVVAVAAAYFAGNYYFKFKEEQKASYYWHQKSTEKSTKN